MLAVAITLAFNATSVVALAYLSQVVRPAEPKPAATARPIPMLERPKRPRKQRARPPTKAAAQGAPELPALHLPSDIRAPSVGETKLDTGNLVRPTLAGERSLGAQEDLIMTEELVDEPPRPVLQPSPRYPAAAQSRRVEGAVEVKVLVDQQGVVRQVIVTHSEPPGVFDQAASDAVRRWRFSPASYQGQRVRVWARQRIEFELE